jgi:hypothetical protein
VRCLLGEAFARLKQGFLSCLALPEKRYVGQEVVARRELMEILDAAALAPIQKIAQALCIRFHGLGVFEEGLLDEKLLDLIRHTLAIGIAILLDRYPTAHSVNRSLPALHGFDSYFEIHPKPIRISPRTEGKTDP